MRSRPRFLADVMLGTLARWLRILGYDTAYDNQIDDDEIVQRCLAENRIALTRDTRLVQRRSLRHYIFIRSDDLPAQIREVLEHLGETVDPESLLIRCLECNTLLIEVTREAVQAEIPPYVYQTHSHFKRCPHCRRIYWGGTHRQHILKQLEGIGEEE